MSVVEGLFHSYPPFRLDIPRWEISDDGITALCGASGSGKTTIFRVLIGLEPCPSLKWNFKGEDLAQMTPGQRHLGVVFQTLELFPHMTAKENILFAARARDLSSKVARERMDALVADLQLDKCIDSKAVVLSGGEAQRVALARAVITQPRFLFLDEPFSSLDAPLKADARALVNSLIRKWRIPTLLITHDEADLKAMTCQIVRLADGELRSESLQTPPANV